jgi:hypothetical protein
MKTSPTQTDTNPGNASKSGSPDNPIQGSKAWDDKRGVRQTKPTVLSAKDNPAGDAQHTVLKHHAVTKAGDEKHPKRPY